MSNLLVSRRGLVLGAAATSLPPLVPAQAKSAELPFVLIGDWGRYGNDRQREVGAAMGRTAADINSRFVISVGDNFYEDGVTGLTDPQWKASFEDIYAAPALQTRWDVILGNHDYRGDVAAQLAYGQLSPRWNMPARFFQRDETLPDGTKAALFYIDTSPFLSIYKDSKVDIRGQDTAAQLAWLDTALGTSTAKWKIVIGHHPLYTVTSGKRDQPELIGPIAPLLHKHGVKIYINGHDHNFQYLVMDGVHYITNGAGSQTEAPKPAKPGQFASGSHGFMTASLSADTFAFAFIDESGTELFRQSVTAT